jgi:hypothetical protein
MLKYSWSELGRLESIFLEILEDPSKKEVLLYPICYCQLVRKIGTFEVPLDKLLSCATKTFKTSRVRWQDIILELDLFQLITPEGDVILGKDILRIGSCENLRISFLPEFREVFYEIYSKFLKYWTVLSKISSYSKRNTPAEAVYLASLIFNEELYGESLHYSQLQGMRFAEDQHLFRAIESLSVFYRDVNEKKVFDPSKVKEALSLIADLHTPYYGINIQKLRKDLEILYRDLTKGKRYFIVKISFTMGSNHGKGLFRGIISGILSKIKHFGGKRWTLMSSEMAFCSSTGTCLIKRREPLILS